VSSAPGVGEAIKPAPGQMLADNSASFSLVPDPGYDLANDGGRGGPVDVATNHNTKAAIHAKRIGKLLTTSTGIKIMNRSTILATACTAWVLAACGGEGGTTDPTAGGGNQPPSTTGPTVLSIAPEMAATGVALDTAITVTFDQAIDCDSFQQAFLLEDEDNSRVDTLIACDANVVAISPAEQLQKHTAYNIRVSTLLKTLAGVALEAAFSAEFLTVERTWSPVIEIGNHGPGANFTNFAGTTTYYAVRVSEPKIAMNLAGDSLVTWIMDNDNPDLPSNESGRHAAYFDSETTQWNAYRTLSLKADPSQAYPGVFASGTAVAAEGGDGYKGTGVNYFLNLSGIWSGAKAIEAPNPQFEYKLRDSATSGFRTTVLWEEELDYFESASSYTEYTYELWLGEYIEGTTSWTSSPLVRHQLKLVNSQLSGTFIREASKVALDTNGNTAIAYATVTQENSEELTGNKYEVCALYNSSTFTEEGCFPTEFPQIREYPQIVMDNLGRALIVWETYEYNEFGNFNHALLFSQYNSVSPGWSDAKPISGMSVFPTSFEIAMNGKGKAILAWASPDGRINAKLYDSVNGWANTQELLDYEAYRPQVAINDAGDIVVSFVDAFDTLYAISYKEGYGWSDLVRLSTSTRNAGFLAYNHDIGLDEEGNAIAVWTELQADPRDSMAVARRFE
jgi:hypothetical protein